MIPATRGDGTAPSPPLVLVVECDADVRRALKFALEIEGYDVGLCESGEALLAHPLPDRRACVVLNQELPGVTGLDTLRILRRRQMNLPVVLVVGQPRRWLRRAVADLGVEVLEKPLLGDSLLDAIRLALAGASNLSRE